MAVGLSVWFISFSAWAADLVIVMHGMGRTSLSMIAMEWFLEEQGFEVDNWNYDGFFTPTIDLAAQLRRKLEQYQQERPNDRIHIVAHSLGGIIARIALSQGVPKNFGRMVQLTPPNQGAQIASEAAPLIKWLLTPIQDLRAENSALVRNIPKLSGVEIVVIKGTNDWLVKEAEADLPEAKYTVQMDTSHSFVMANSEVQEIVKHFLNTGQISPIAPMPAPSHASP
jgi:hypothetical protein